MAIFLLLAYSVTVETPALAYEPQRHTFTSGDHIITMDVHFFKPYAGKRLAFYSDSESRNQACFAGNGESGACPDHFVGVVATVTFTVKAASGGLRGSTSIREKVTVTAQSPDLPLRNTFDKTQVLTNGAITDVQAFGYDETEMAESVREAERKKSKERLWRVCEQKLYLNNETMPFASITWLYTLDAIRILSVQGR